MARRVAAYTLPVIVCLLLALCFGQQPATDREARRVDRMFTIGQLWGTIRHFHPYLAYREDIDWDQALITTLKRISAGTTDADYAAIVGDLLKTLGDPVTRLVQSAEPARSALASPELSRTTEDGILIVSIRDYAALGGDQIEEKLSGLVKNFEKVRGVLIDLRPLTAVSRAQMAPIVGDAIFPSDSILLSTGFASALTARPLFTPATRRLVYRTYAGYSDGATVAFQVTRGARVVPGRSSQDVPVVFLTDPRSAVPPAAVAFQTAGRGAIVAVGGATEESLIDVHTMELPGGLVAQIRLAELVTEAGAITFRPDLVIPTSESDASALQRALTVVRNFASQPYTETLSPIIRLGVENGYPAMRFPSREYRLLAAFRIWSAVHFFFPAKNLTGEDWDSVVRQAIPEFEGAHNASEYTFAVAGLIHHLYDSHGLVFAPEFDEQFGAQPPVQLQFVEGLPVITAIRNADVQKESGVQIGDVVTAIDGEKVENRIAYWTKAVSASTPQSERFKVANFLLAGKQRSTVDVNLRKQNGSLERASLERSSKTNTGFSPWGGRAGAVYRVLPGNIGYADLERLDEPAVRNMYALFRDTKAIIFDMRGYPQHDPWSSLERLNGKERVPAAISEEWWVHSPVVPDGISVNREMQYVDAGAGDYRGKTAVLIDGRAVSQAEHLALHLKAVGAVLVGSATAGADCVMARFAVPGGIGVSFSANLVREPSGRLIQRAGVLPDVPVEPTIDGIRAGRDEVLDRAMEVVSKSAR